MAPDGKVLYQGNLPPSQQQWVTATGYDVEMGLESRRLELQLAIVCKGGKGKSLKENTNTQTNKKKKSPQLY